MIYKVAFYGSLRRRESGVFGTSLRRAQVDGIEALLAEGKDLPLHHMANVLAQVYHETGGRMTAVRETFADSDAQAIARLDRAWAKGQLPWVKTPYWRDGWFGRGQIQLTGKANYARFGISNPDDALNLHISAHIAVKGMHDGMFTGKKLADFDFPAALDNSPGTNPRRIVNGKDGTDAVVAGYHRAFAAALKAGAWGAAVAPAPVAPVKPSSPPVAPAVAPAGAIVAAVVLGASGVAWWGVIKTWFGG